MRATSIGHAGILIETVDGSILCDPWFVPAFFGSWFVFPRNDQLAAELLRADRAPDVPVHLAPPRRPPRRAVARRSRRPRHDGPAPRLPDPRAGAQRLRALGFTKFVRTDDGERARRSAEPDASPSTSRRASPTAPAATRRWSSATARRGSSTRTTAAPPTSTRCAPTARSTCTGCSTAGRSGTRWSTTSRRERDARAGRRQGRQPVHPGDALRRGGRRPRRRAERRAAVLPRPGAVPPQRDHAATS